MALSDSHRDARELRLQLSAMQQALTESHGAHDVRRQELELMSDWVKRLQTSLQRRSGRLSGGIATNESARPSLGNAAVTVSAVTEDRPHNRLFAAVERATSAARDTDVEDDAVVGAAVDAAGDVSRRVATGAGGRRTAIALMRRCRTFEFSRTPRSREEAELEALSWSPGELPHRLY
jgi:hypothetical protein